MKRLFTLFAMAVIATVSISAQTFIFVDAQGNEIKDGSTIYMTEVEEDFFDGNMVKLKGVYIKNVSDSDASLYMDATIVSNPGNKVQCCFGTQCKEGKTGTINIENVKLNAGKTDELKNTEWFVGDCTDGKATVTFQLGTKDKINGPKITVNFLYGNTATSVKNVSATKVPVAYYSINGKEIKAPMKGITLVKYSDGTVNRVYNK